MTPNPDQIPYVSQLRRLGSIEGIEDIPVVGSVYHAGNTVIDYAESDCHPGLDVYIETLFPALGQAVLTLLSFGLDDILRGYLRPAGGRGFGGLGRASRRTRRLTRAQRARGLLRGGIPEIGELVGKHLPGAETVRGRNIGNAQRWIFRVDAIAQRGLYYWMIADLADDFVTNWTSALLESEECNCPDASGFTRTGGGFGVSEGGAWEGFPVPLVTESWGMPLHDAFSVVLDHGQSASITMFGNPERGTIFQDGVAHFRLRHVESGAVVDITHNDKTATELAGETISNHGQVSAPGTWRWEVRTNGPAVIITEPQVMVWISGCTGAESMERGVPPRAASLPLVPGSPEQRRQRARRV